LKGLNLSFEHFFLPFPTTEKMNYWRRKK